MAQLTKAAFLAKWGDAAGEFEATGLATITGSVMQDFAIDLKDSVSFNLDGAIKTARVTVSSASLLTLGTVPVQIIAAPGANKYLAIHKIFASYKYGTVAYDFGLGEDPAFKWTTIFAGYGMNTAEINLTNSFNIFLANYAISGSGSSNLQSPTNEALRLTTIAGTNPSTGDGDLDVVVYYTIEDVNV